MDPFIAEIKLFAGNFAPRGWAFCEGQLLPINQNQALFSIIGTIYGGDGRTTFALPDLRGRVAIGPGNGPGLSSYREGQKGGTEGVTLITSEMPSHNHTGKTMASDAAGNSPDPTNHNFANTSAFDNEYTTAPANVSMASGNVTIGHNGGNQSHENRQPFLAVYYIIALQGVFPSRS